MLQQEFHPIDGFSKVETQGYGLPLPSHIYAYGIDSIRPFADAERHPTNKSVWIAKSKQPWVELLVDISIISGCSVEMVFEASIIDCLTRPLIRFVFQDYFYDNVLPAPVRGKGTWTGHVPSEVKQILISPVDMPGPFGFRVISCYPIGKWRKTQRALKYHPFSISWAAVQRVAGYSNKARRRLQRAWGATPLSAHQNWLTSRTRVLEWNGLDAPRTAEAPHLRVILIDGTAEQEAEVVDVLAGQPRSEWSVLRASTGTTVQQLVEDRDPDDFLIVLNAGDAIMPEAPAVFAEMHARNLADLYFADELDSNCGIPRFKPDWGPVLSQSIDILGSACFYRVGWLRTRVGERTIGAFRPVQLSSDDKIVHIKRLLVACKAVTQMRAPPALPTMDIPACSIIIPIRDHHDLLRQCLDSILSNVKNVRFEIIVVDNDSTEAETTKYLLDISREPRIRILHAPGPFNFSALCNAGAKAAQFDMLVFLNNDTKVLSSDWLEKLTAWARRPDIGAVGAKLLFPNVKVQHAGVALGLHGTAAHFEAGSSPDSIGYFGRLEVPHELSAVTGACLVIERSKFDLVEGFDGVNLPVEYGDIDLCLKLQERGLRNLIEPRARLVHLESASRGNTVPPEIRYKDETAYFKQRWFSVIRNDPYLHPALSIETTEAALG